MEEIFKKIDSMLEKGSISSVSIKIEKVGDYQKTNIDIKASEETTFNIDTLNLSKDTKIEDVAKELSTLSKRQGC